MYREHASTTDPAIESAGPVRVDLRPLLPRNLFDTMRDSTPSRQFNYVYIPLGKCANTHIKRFLWALHRRHGYSIDVPSDYFAVHNNWNKSYLAEPCPWDCYVMNDHERLLRDLVDGDLEFRFTFVRNPYARLLSAYNDKIVNSKSPPAETARKFNLTAMPLDFSDFAHMVVEQDDEERNIHWSSQIYRLAYEFFDYTFIGSVEHLDAGKAYLQAAIFGEAEGEVEPVSAPKHFTGSTEKVETAYTPELARSVRDAYARDFDILGYDDDHRNIDPIRPPVACGQHKAVLQRFRPAIETGMNLKAILGKPEVTA